MKKYLKICSFMIVIFVAGCSGGKEESVYVSSEDYEKLKSTVVELRSEIKAVQGQLIDSDNKINHALQLLEKRKALKDDINRNSSFVEKIRNIDFDAIDELKNQMSVIEDKAKANLVKKRKKSLVWEKRVKTEKSKLNVFLSQINNWGGSLVAIIKSPGKGFETLSVNSSVGNGWHITKIEVDKVIFIHKSGKKSKVFL